MKKLALLSLYLLFFSLIAAQSNFQRHYGQPSNLDEVAGLATTLDGHYLAAGTTANLGAGGLDMLLEKVDPAGNSVWRKTWGQTGNDGANQVIGVSSGGFLVSGYTEGENNSRDFAAVRFDEEGNELWRIIRGAEYDDEALCAVEMPDGGLLIIGYTGLPDIMEEGLLLVRTDSEGALVWEKTLFLTGNMDIIGCAPANDGGFFVVLRPNILIKLDGLGNQLWQTEVTDDFGATLELAAFQRTADGQLRIGGWASGAPFLTELNENGELGAYIELPINTGFDLVNSFALTPGGKLWVTISTQFGNPALFSTLLYLIDPATDEILLSRTGAELGLDGLALPFSIHPTAEGEGFLFAGNSISNAKGRNGLLYLGNEQAEETWRKTIGVEKVYDQETGRMVVEAADGGFLIAGARPTVAAERNLWLIRTNATGNVQWSADIGSAQNDAVTALATRADGSFVVAGYHSDTIILSAFSDNGTPLWYRELFTGLSDGTFGMTTNSENEILLTMPVYHEGEPKGFLIKLNAQGTSQWVQYYQPIIPFSATYGITVSADGGYFLCGCAEDEENNFTPLLLKTDAEGNELWSSLYNAEEGVFNCLITAYQHSNGDVFANGIGVDGGTRPYVMRVNSEGGLIWQQLLELDEEENSYFTWFSGLQPNINQQLLFGRKTFLNTLQPQGGSAGAITALHPDGTIAWERDYGRAQNGGFQGGTATSDGGIVAVGTATFDNSQDAWLVKTEADGTVGLSAPLTPPFELSLSPNPAKDWLQLSVSGLEEGKAQLTIFNLNGQQLRSEKLPTTGGRLNYSIPVGNLAPGGYFLHLLQGTKGQSVKWVKGVE